MANYQNREVDVKSRSKLERGQKLKQEKIRRAELADKI